MTFDSTKQPATFQHPLATLPREDLDLITELVIQSGSLKDLAAAYGVSYPTIRARVDRVIDRLKEAVAGRKPDPFSELLANLVQRGEMSGATARMLRQAARDLLAREAGAAAKVEETKGEGHEGGAV
jgi:hypothetical protein